MFITLIGIIILLVVFIRLSVVFKGKVQFFAQGLDLQFSFQELSLLWKLAKICALEEPTALYISEQALNKAIAKMIDMAQLQGTQNSPETQEFLSKLYAYRTKIAIDEQKFRGIVSSKSLDVGQKLNILLPGNGVFTSEVVNNARDLIIAVPKKNGSIVIGGEKWIGKNLSVYLWRKGDAGYVFDTKVLTAGSFLSRSVLSLSHSEELERTQKRKSVRCACKIPVSLYILKPTDFESINYSAVESLPGYKAELLDISESGALVKVGGRGYEKMGIKLQFELFEKIILMYGIVHSVDFNAAENFSLMHFECTHLDSSMRNEILGYVYNIVPQSQKEKLDAMALTEKDEDMDMEEIMRKEDALLKNLPPTVNSAPEPEPKGEV